MAAKVQLLFKQRLMVDDHVVLCTKKRVCKIELSYCYGFLRSMNRPIALSYKIITPSKNTQLNILNKSKRNERLVY